VKQTYNNLKVWAATISLILITVFAVGIAAASPSIAANSLSKSPVASVNSSIPITKLTAVPIATPTPTPKPTATPTIDASAVNVTALKAQVPVSYKDAQASISVRTRYLIYTSDGVHIMWGFEGNNRFVGTDNNGKQCWGIFGDGIFAGFYDGTFFWGKYASAGTWKAQSLFGLNTSQGSYILFPQAIAVPVTSVEP
jgi:hypothetical protein